MTFFCWLLHLAFGHSGPFTKLLTPSGRWCLICDKCTGVVANGKEKP